MTIKVLICQFNKSKCPFAATEVALNGHFVIFQAHRALPIFAVSP
jgi:hypothetical protein